MHSKNYEVEYKDLKGLLEDYSKELQGLSLTMWDIIESESHYITDAQMKFIINYIDRLSNELLQHSKIKIKEPTPTTDQVQE